MKDLTSTTSVLQAIQKWFNSLTGTLTVLAILAAIGIIATMAARESYGKNSFGHRTVRVIAIALYTVIAVNLAGTFIERIFSLTWLTTSLLILICASLIYLAFTRDLKAKPLSAVLYLVTSYIILVGGSQGIYHNENVTIVVGFIGLITYAILLGIVGGIATSDSPSANNGTCEMSPELLNLTAEKLATYIIEHQTQSNSAKDNSAGETESSSTESETIAHDDENVAVSNTQGFIDALLEKTDLFLQKRGVN